MKRLLVFTFLFPLLALLIGVFVTDFTPLRYDDWQWRYGTRVGLALLAIIISRVLAWRLPLRYRWVALIALLPLVFSIPHIRDLQGGVGRQYVATIPDEPGEEAIQYEQLWLPYTDRMLR